MIRSYCNVCSCEIESRDQSSMQECAGDFGADVTLTNGKMVKVSAMVLIDGIAGPDDFDMCLACWWSTAARFAVTRRAPTPAQKLAEERTRRFERAPRPPPEWQPPTPPFGDGGVEPLGPLGFLSLCILLSTVIGGIVYWWLR